MNKSKQLLFSITKKDFEMQTFCTGGKGGQNQNHNNMGVRLIHRPSGAVGEGREERNQLQNKKNAFQKLINTPEFKKWHKIMCSKALGNHIDVEKWVEKQMDLKNLRIEIQVNGKWIEAKTLPDSFDELEE